MRRGLILGQWTMFVCMALTSSDGGCSPPLLDERSGRTQAEALRTRCGPRAAWVFSRCCGVPLDHDSTMGAFPAQDAVSLGEIAGFLMQQRIPCEARCISPSDLTSERCPIIAHLAPSHESDEFGHFVVVVDANENGVTIVEPQVGRQEKWTWHYFSDRWTGHCIMRAPHQSFDRQILSLFIALNLIAAACLYLR